MILFSLFSCDKVSLSSVIVSNKLFISTISVSFPLIFVSKSACLSIRLVILSCVFFNSDWRLSFSRLIEVITPEAFFSS